MNPNAAYPVVIPRVRQRGFSLIELMVTVTLLSILMLLAFPAFSEWIQNSRIRTAAEAVQNGLQLARAEAVKRNARVEFALTGTTSGWTVRSPPGGTAIQQRASNQGSANVVTTTGPAGATKVIFDGLGRANTTNADGTGILRTINLDVPVAVLAAARSRDLRITIGVDGAIRMCDPNVADTDPRKC